MRIGVMGTGAMAESLGGAWVRAGHEVFVGGRDEAAAGALARRIGAAGHGSPARAAEYGELALLAVPAEAAAPLAAEHAAALAGRTVVDCTNPLAPGPGGVMLTTGGGPSTAALVQAAAPGAHVVKAFNLAHASVWGLPVAAFGGTRPAVPYCADDAGAAERVAELVTGMGWTPMPAGGLDRAGYVEATAAFVIGVWWAGGSPRLAFPEPVAAEQAVAHGPRP
ncbi:NAD(P)-binding domain-containing protein [Streptomyces sp. NBC_00193]|uniref:NADPH-dependent F420 reductase n=1 Tax=unclassified Streptomyces TaxID=2593676 RepID=UPI0022529341|nr:MULTISPECIES: NAD(P)-binding domain-containing protein [unclassified Streptomyces]MCX5123849.1 NAD(P)-binding domain-containing protein [Streptomyces sp. NBC_00347]MCX5297094.1 NAD(P)-binding domain-containing protein [Streptomyces sp. NBC_00193]